MRQNTDQQNELVRWDEHSISVTFNIVVAKYLENIDWISKYNLEQYTVVYDKSTEYSPFSPYNVIPLPNYGRESHSFLYHIIKNWDILPDVLVFTQADPFPHADLDSWYTDILQAYVTGCFNNWQVDGCHGHTGHHFNIDHYGGVPMELIDMNMGQWFIDIIGEPRMPCPLTWRPAASGMAISTSLIKTREKTFYERLYNRLDGKINPAEGHFFERAWYYIFNCHKFATNILHKPEALDIFLS